MSIEECKEIEKTELSWDLDIELLDLLRNGSYQILLLVNSHLVKAHRCVFLHELGSQRLNLLIKSS